MGGFGQLVPPRSVVIRGGHFQTVPAENLVPGDLIRMKGGDKVPADIRLIQCNGLKVRFRLSFLPRKCSTLVGRQLFSYWRV